MDDALAGDPPAHPSSTYKTERVVNPVVHANHRLQPFSPSCFPTDAPGPSTMTHSAIYMPSHVVTPPCSTIIESKNVSSNTLASFPRVFVANAMFDSPMTVLHRFDAKHAPQMESTHVDVDMQSRKRARTDP